MKIKYNKETYKDIPGWPGYQVSVRGNVRSLAGIDTRGHKRKEKQLKPNNTHGYRQVKLTKDGKSKQVKIHRLVMLTFIGPPPEGMVVDHWDENPTNNKLCNLSYMTKADNTYRSMKNMSSQHRGIHWNKARNKWKVQIYIDGKQKYLGSFNTEQEAAECIKEFKNK